MIEFCCKCHTSYGSAEPKIFIDAMRTMHKHCYQQHLRELSTKAEERRPTCVRNVDGVKKTSRTRRWLKGII